MSLAADWKCGACGVDFPRCPSHVTARCHYCDIDLCLKPCADQHWGQQHIISHNPPLTATFDYEEEPK